MNATLLVLFFAAVAAGILLFTFLRARRLHHENLVLKEEIRKWEDEGGNAPQNPAQTGG